jgi:nucleotide-binding universal stress UspA family protein
MEVAPIVAGTDGSATAERAVDKAIELAAALGADLHLVTSFDMAANAVWMAAASGIATGPITGGEAAQEHAESVLERSRERLGERGVTVRTHLCSGDAADALLTIAADEGAQMIVVGNRGMSGARRVLGSVPNRVSHRAKCGVLIVPTG